MNYHHTTTGIFRSRPNRFLAQVEIGGKTELCHVKNTGRLGELLLPGTPAVLDRHEPGKRKTNYSLIAVRKEGQWVNIDSQAPNAAAAEWLSGSPLGFPVTLLRREQTFGDSRFDFYLEGEGGQKAFLEVKGVTLEVNGIARFPDAPTERGVKHIRHLIEAREAGYLAYLLFVIQMKGVTAWGRALSFWRGTAVCGSREWRSTLRWPAVWAPAALPCDKCPFYLEKYGLSRTLTRVYPDVMIISNS